MTRATRSVFYIEIFHDRRRLIPLVITGIRWRGTRSIQEKKKKEKEEEEERGRRKERGVRGVSIAGIYDATNSKRSAR